MIRAYGIRELKKETIFLCLLIAITSLFAFLGEIFISVKFGGFLFLIMTLKLHHLL